MAVKRNAARVRQDQRATIYFVTFTCHKWLPLFEETKLYENIYNWFKLLNEKNIKTVGFVLMPNYLHCLLYLPKEAPELNNKPVFKSGSNQGLITSIPFGGHTQPISGTGLKLE